MADKLPTNKPSRLESIYVVKGSTATGERLAHDLEQLKSKIAPVADKRFVLFKNKKVWFDRNVSGLFPRMEDRDLRSFVAIGDLRRAPFNLIRTALLSFR